MNGSGSGTKKILVIDDEVNILKLTKINLEACGYQVMTLNSGDHAVEEAKAGRPDLILLDVVMRGKNGCDVCRELKADEATRAIPVIISTAHYPEEEYIKVSSGDVGADDYILKPFEIQDLVAKIKFLIK
ncbi:MAG: response regulator [Candidatus Omnitrophota bacterium]|jgi:DNA-binding response OmpR family regulator